MAGTRNLGESSDNPVAINVTAMVDVIFCLCIFFMCSFHFKQLEGKIESWLPKEGQDPGPAPRLVADEIRVVMRWDAQSGATLRCVRGGEYARSDEELMAAVCARRDGFVRSATTGWRLKIDADPAVPWADVVHIMDLCRLRGIEPIELAALEPDGRGR